MWVLLTVAKIDYGDGRVAEAKLEFVLKETTTPLEILKATASIRLITKSLGCSLSRATFLQSINGVSNRRNVFWIVLVNRQLIEAAVDQFQVSERDAIEFQYRPFGFGRSKAPLALAPSSISIILDRVTVAPKEKVTISGSLLGGVKGSEAPIPNAAIYIYVSIDGGAYAQIPNSPVTTDSNGYYEIAYYPQTAGTYTFYSEFLGDATYAGCNE